MGRRNKRALNIDEIVESVNNLIVENPLLPFVLPLILVLWGFEKWIFSVSGWVPLAVAVWATLQYGSHQRRLLIEDLNKRRVQDALNTSPLTPLEHCQWLNKLLIEVWPNFMNPKLSIRFSSIVEKRLRHLNAKIIEKVELLEFSLGSSAPSVGLQGAQWVTSGDQKTMRLGFDWNTNDMSILLLAKLGKPLMGTARIVINSLHIKGDLKLMPVLDGKAILFSFVTTPDVRIGVAFGSGGSQSLPATELPGVSSMLVKVLTDTLVKTMVEPRRRCFSLPAVDFKKKAVGGVIHVTVISAAKLLRSNFKGSPSRRLSIKKDSTIEEHTGDKELQTLVEVELEGLNRRTDVARGSSPKWDSTFNMMLHEDYGLIRFFLYECPPNSVNYNYLACCEVKLKYVADDSTTFWAIGPDSSILVKLSEFPGKEVEMTVPFEGVNSGELTLRLVLKEWQFSDGSHSFNNLNSSSSRLSLNGSPLASSRTGRKINITVAEGKNLTSKDKSGKYDPYVKLQYGKVLQRTRTVQQASSPIWNQKFEFDEIAGVDYLRLKCNSEETFNDDSLGSARVNLEGLVEGVMRDVWVPLEKVNSGELRLQIEVVKVDDFEGSRGSSLGSGNGLIELVLIEARDLIAADLRGTSDPYVRVHYGDLKRRTKVIHKTLNPRWNQMLEFPDDGSTLELHLKDHNSLLPTSNIGDCVVEYQRLPPNQMADKWIPLQGVKRGEIHIQITRKVPTLQQQEKPSLNAESSSAKAHQISRQMKQMMVRLQSVVEHGNSEVISEALSELESLEDTQEEYMVQLETEQTLLLNKIRILGEEFSSTPPLSRAHSVT